MGRIIFKVDDGSQNMFIYQPTFDNINVKETNNEYNVYAWKSKGIYSTELKPLHDLAPVIAYYKSKIAFRFNYRILTITQKTDINLKLWIFTLFMV